MDPPQIPAPPVAPTEAFVPTTDENYPRFRILIVGRSGVGKSSLINAILKAPVAEVQKDNASAADINNGLTSPHNKHLILHEFGGYEPGEEDKFGILEKFIRERSQMQSPTERLHAIWLCIPTPYSIRLFEPGKENIFRLNRNKVPIIVVITKFDLYMSRLQRRAGMRNKISNQSAEDDFKKRNGSRFGKNNATEIPYTFVSKTQFDSFLRLFQITKESLQTKTPGVSSGVSHGSDEDLSGSAQIALATAQRVDMAGKIDASIKVGKRTYCGIHFGISLEKCLRAIHKDIVTIWNIRVSHDYLLSDAFHHRMMVIVEDLTSAATTEISVTSAMGLAKSWTSGVFKERPEHIRCLMGYVVDLTLVLQAIFQVSLDDQFEGKVELDRIDEIIDKFHCSEKKKRIHNVIRTFSGAQHPLANYVVADKIESLIRENEMTQNLRRIFGLELAQNGLIRNQTFLDLVRESLLLPTLPGIITDIDPLDVELLFDFMLYLLQNNRLSAFGIPDVNSKAMRLMFKLIFKTKAIPRTLYVTDISTNTDLGAIGVRGYAHAFNGKSRGQDVELKMLYKGHKDLSKDFFQEVLAWRSLSNRFILPLLGIFREKTQLFLVSPYMANGTLSEWRKNQPPVIAEIHRLMLEVAEGIEYIHSKGIVHGDLRGENILLDSELHCQISDIGLTWHSDATTLAVLNFAAPELFAICDKCYRFDCDGCNENLEVKARRTIQTDVYAFGCLHYATFFDSVPFREKQQLQIPRLVTSRARPARLTCPIMDDGVWNLIENCWKHNPAERPTTKDIVDKCVTFLATLPSLLATLRQLEARGSYTVNDHTFRLISRLLEQYESDTIASELETISDVELFLDFTLHLLRSGPLSSSDGVRDVNRKARSLMFKLINSRDVMPKSLFITGITTDTDLGDISTVHIEHSFWGDYRGQQVALRALCTIHDNDMLKKDVYLEALQWRSLTHDFVLPLRGIFEENSYSFLVSPFTIHGTITEWRKNQKPDVKEIQRLMSEVAKGIQYIHAEGIIHGDIRGENILLDSALHCKIANVGLTPRSDVIGSSILNFTAPELFDMSNDGDRPDDDSYKAQPAGGRKTVQTDVYAMGCLCYAIFFDTVPFQDASRSQVLQLVKNGLRPTRLNNPTMDDGFWNVIQHCWMQNPSKRPMMEHIVRAGMTFTSFQFLLTTLSKLKGPGSSMVNEETVRLICELLDLPGSYVAATELKNKSDVELLLDFIVDLLRSDGLANVGIQGANRKARQLMFKLISKTNVVPKSFFITNVTNLEAIGIGGFGRVSKGLHKGRTVAVKELYKGFHKNSLPTDFCREALVWRSLSHRFIVPLLGIYERNSQLSFVSPYMPNGTLTQWRKDHKGDASEIYRLMLEAGEGVHYLHSEGIVHGDLHGGNILLDAQLHCQIIDFGLTRHAEATVTKSTTTFVSNFAAPELFGGMCITCGQQDCDGCSSSNDVQHTGKTEKTDVYAFGCLYYAIFFDTAPFNGNSELQIMRLVTTGGRPDRLENPKMEDETWDLVQSCWNYKPSERPTMEEIVKTLIST